MEIISEVSQSKPFFALRILSFMKRHWYILVFLIIVIPSILSSIVIATQTQDYFKPLFELGKKIFGADIVLKEIIQSLRTDPSVVIGMVKPTAGIWLTVKYYWFLIWRVYYQIFSLLWLIFSPAIFIHYLLKLKNTYEIAKQFIYTTIFFLSYLFIINAVYIIYQLSSGTLVLTLPDGSEANKVWYIFKSLLPLNGVYSLGVFIWDYIYNLYKI